MRVITGTARGRRLNTPENYDVRPTGDKVKEAVFNIIQFDIEGRRVLDLFAGTGQLGIEALSRGAASAVFVDSSRTSIEIVKKNLKLCNLEAEVYTDDSVLFLRRINRKFDVIFIDPPYDSPVYDSVISLIENDNLLNDGGVCVCESRLDRDFYIPKVSPYSTKVYNYGKTKITIVRKEVL